MADNHFAAVGAIVLKDGKALLVRHTYGGAKGKLLNPGGMLREGELPYDAVVREVWEETGVTVNPVGLLSMRCAKEGWYMVFLAEYVSGEPRSDNAENSEALFMDCAEVLARADTTETVKTLLRLARKVKPLPMRDAGKNRIMFTAGE